MKTIPTLFALLFFSIVVNAQTSSIKGQLKKENKTPIANATVLLKKESKIIKYATSNQEGYYEISEIQNGDYSIEVSSLETQKIVDEIIITEKNTVLDYTLKEQIYELDNIQLVQESERTKTEKKGFAVNVIETKDFEKRNIQTNELLGRTVGLKIRQNGGLGSDIKYYINGLSGNSIRIFIDGLPISTYGSSFNLNSIPPNLIEKIEVYKGVVPGHLSDDSLGGAINIVLKKGNKNNINASVSYGSFNTSQFNFNALYRFKATGFTLKTSGYFNYSDNDYEVWGQNVYNIKPNGQYEYVRAKRFNDQYKSIGGIVEVGYTNVKWADNFLLGFTISDSHKEIQHGTFMTTPYKGRYVESDAKLFQVNYTKKNIINGLDFNLNAVIGERSRFVNDTVKWVHNWYGEKSYDLNGNPILTPNGAQQGAPTLATIKRNVASVRSGLSYAINANHKILINNLYSLIDRTDDDEKKSILERKFEGTRDLTKNITALSYEFQGINDRLKTTLFAKNYHQKIARINPEAATINGETVITTDEVNNTINTNGYGGALAFSILPNITLLTSAEKAIRLPNENEIFGDSGDNISENPNIKAETSQNLNLGVRLGNFNIKKHQFLITANTFIRKIEDRIGYPVQTSLNSNIQTLPYVNQGNVKSKGIDTEFNYIFNNNLTVKINATKFELTTVNNGIEYDLPNEPFFNTNFSTQYSINKFIQAKSSINLYYNFMFVEEFSYIRKLYGNNTGTDFFLVPNQFIQDFGCTYTFPNPNYSLSFDVKNIFNEQAFDNMAVQKPGRAFYLKFNLNLNTL